MATLFTRIINGELPGRFVWRDPKCVAFLSINPLKPGHTLVVPCAEIDHWLDLDDQLTVHLFRSAKSIGAAIQHAFQPKKVGMMIAGLEVPHVHIHLVPVDEIHDLNFDRQDKNPDPAALDQAANRIRASLRQLGYQQVAD